MSLLRNGRQFILSCSSIHCVIISCNVNYSLRAARLKATWIDRKEFLFTDNCFSFFPSSARRCSTSAVICFNYLFFFFTFTLHYATRMIFTSSVNISQSVEMINRCKSYREIVHRCEQREKLKCHILFHMSRELKIL